MKSINANSDELVSWNGSDDENSQRPRYPEYKKFTKHKEFPILKLGMKFINATGFRKALRVHAVISGYDISWDKNEGNMVICICKGNKKICK